MRVWRKAADAATLLLWLGAAAAGDADAADRPSCALWLADSAVPGIGRGVFAGTDFRDGQALTVAAALGVPKDTTSLTQLFNYVYEFSARLIGHGQPASLLLGAASLINHGEPERINSGLKPVSKSHIAVHASRPITAGEELFTSYGTSDWFVDRGIPYVAPPPAASAEGNPGLTSPRRSLEELEANGTCLAHVSPDLVRRGVLAQRSFLPGDTLESPLFVVPRAAVRSAAVLSHCLGRPGYDVMLLPLTLPGPLVHGRPANVNVSLKLDAATSGGGLHELCDASSLPATLQLTVLRPIHEGERLVVDFEQAWSAADAKAADFVPVSEHFFPESWRGRSVQADRLRAADAGDPAAQFRAGEVHRVGLPGAGVEPNETAAAAWFKRAADSGHTRAQLRFAAALHAGRGAPRDLRAAAEMYGRAAEGGSVLAVLLLAELHTDGDAESGVPVNRSAAAELLHRAAETGTARLSSHSDAFFSLAVAFQEGSGGPPNASAAALWFRVAAEAGHAGAQYELGKGYAGDGPEAARWLLQAAEADHPDAQFALGEAFAKGRGVDQNETASREWYRRAAGAGHAGAQYQLGMDLVGEDATQAVQWLLKAGDAGHLGAQFALGVAYGRGMGVKQNDSAAAEWYRKAAEKGLGSAQYNLAVAYEAGLGVPRDARLAKEWFQKAAERGATRPEEPARTAPWAAALGDWLSRLWSWRRQEL